MYSPTDLKEFAPPTTATDLRELLAESIIEIRSGKMDPKIANALGYLGASYMKAIEVSEVQERLNALESRQVIEERAFLQSNPVDSAHKEQK
jgi:hypothetical protein